MIFIYFIRLINRGPLVSNLKTLKKNCICCYISQLPFSPYSSEGIKFTKVNRLSSESLLCKKIVTIYLSACNFAIIYLYKDIKFKAIFHL